MTTTSQTDCGQSGANGDAEALRRISVIGAQNDRFRTSLNGDPELVGKILITPGVTESGPEFLLAAYQAVRDFTDFSEDNDPYHERDFAAVEVMGTKIFWKIDVYDTGYLYGSENPEDPAQSRRVLTLMLPIEY